MADRHVDGGHPGNPGSYQFYRGTATISFLKRMFCSNSAYTPSSERAIMKGQKTMHSRAAVWVSGGGGSAAEIAFACLAQSQSYSARSDIAQRLSTKCIFSRRFCSKAQHALSDSSWELCSKLHV